MFSLCSVQSRLLLNIDISLGLRVSVVDRITGLEKKKKGKADTDADVDAPTMRDIDLFFLFFKFSLVALCPTRQSAFIRRVLLHLSNTSEASLMR